MARLGPKAPVKDMAETTRTPHLQQFVNGAADHPAVPRADELYRAQGCPRDEGGPQ